MAKESPENRTRIQQAMIRVFRVVGWRSAQTLAYVSALGAVVYVTGPVAAFLGLPTIPENLAWKPALDLIASTIGVNIFSTLLLQLAEEKEISPDEIRSEVERAIEGSGIKQHITDREFRRTFAPRSCLGIGND